MSESTAHPTGMLIVIPSRLAVGEEFAVSVKLRGPVHKIPCAVGWNLSKPRLRGPFNLNVERQIQFSDDCLPQWAGKLRVDDGNGALQGPGEIVFDGKNQGAFPGDTRPILRCPGFCWTKSGFHFLRLTDPASGLQAWSNPVYVTPEPPAEQIYWGDPHWQTFFSDGIRCPEELYAFARDEAFLDFGAISDHTELITDRQWDYFQAVTNDYNEPGRFVTLIGQEWTNHSRAKGIPGHRNIYYRGERGPILRCNDADCDTLEKLWRRLDDLPQLDPVAIPHHSANVTMGVNWDQGWNAKYEKAVEIYSVWGSSEKPASAGNSRPIQSLGGERPGGHVVDALRRGFRMGFVGGGDIHDGRPGDDLHTESYPPSDFRAWPQGFTAAFCPQLTRESVFDAIKLARTYATTKRRIYFDVQRLPDGRQPGLRIQAAAEDGLQSVSLVINGEDARTLSPSVDPRILDITTPLPALGSNDFVYLRATTQEGHLAWSSPIYGGQA